MLTHVDSFGHRRQNGTLVWEITTEGRIRSSPTVFENVLFFGSGDGKVRALNARGAETRISRLCSLLARFPCVHNCAPIEFE